MKRVFGVLAVAVLSAGLAQSQEVVEYVHLDALGSVRAVSNQANVVIERHDYLPFGEECTTGPCTGNPGVGGGQPRKFTGKERDQETGLDYFGARYYGSKVGRFTSVDPALNVSAASVDPQRWNRYTYTLNNPLRSVDPDGRDTVDLVIGFGQGAAVTAAGLAVGTLQTLDTALHGPAGIVSASIEFTEAAPRLAEDAKLIGFGLTHPSELADQYMRMSTSNNGADQRAIGAAGGQTAVLTIAVLAPFAKTTAPPGEILSRYGTSYESATRLARKAAEAEGGRIGIHGVSSSAAPATGEVSTATRAAVEQHFQVHNTPTRADPLHRTIELAKPVTREIAEQFNAIFGRSK